MPRHTMPRVAASHHQSQGELHRCISFIRKEVKDSDPWCCRRLRFQNGTQEPYESERAAPTPQSNGVHFHTTQERVARRRLPVATSLRRSHATTAKGSS